MGTQDLRAEAERRLREIEKRGKKVETTISPWSEFSTRLLLMLCGVTAVGIIFLLAWGSEGLIAYLVAVVVLFGVSLQEIKKMLGLTAFERKEAMKIFKIKRDPYTYTHFHCIYLGGHSRYISSSPKYVMLFITEYGLYFYEFPTCAINMKSVISCEEYHDAPVSWLNAKATTILSSLGIATSIAMSISFAEANGVERKINFSAPMGVMAAIEQAQRGTKFTFGDL